MRIIVCGAGQVGTGIARQLTSEDNDVIIIDENPEIIKKVNEGLDVKAFVGVPSHPTVLQEAGAETADMIIAVTTSDETNMVACQVAHSLFNMHTKVARIRNQNYLHPMWKDLYRKDHLPIDYIISPELEVANAIMNRLHVPGAMDMIPFAEGKVLVIEVRCSSTCALINLPLSQVRDILIDLNVSIVGLMRENSFMMPDKKETLQTGDAVFFITSKEHVTEAMKIFGHKEKEARKILIIGGGNIGMFLAEKLEHEEMDINAKLIELNRARAEYVASRLQDTIVINGDALDNEILLEANIEHTETVISVSNEDEVNILSSLLAKRYGCARSIALINKSTSYSPLMSSLGIDVIVNPRETTVSSILRHIRKGKVRAAHSICGGEAEIIEVEAFHNSSVIGKAINNIGLPQGAIIGAIMRQGKVIIPKETDIIKEGDHVLLLSILSQVKKIDTIFSARQDFF